MDRQRLADDLLTGEGSTVISTDELRELSGNKISVNIELPIFLTLFSLVLSATAISNVILYRTCVHALHHDEDVCKSFLSPDRFNISKELEDEVQKYVTTVSTVKTILESLTPAVLSFYLGVWSDTYGRKPLIVWPLFGIAITQILTVIYTTLDGFGPWWYILTAIPYSVTGGFTVLFTGAFTYLSDITSTKNRSLRLTILQAMISLGSVLGGVCSSYLIKAVGTVYLVLIVTSLNVVAYAFSVIFLKESLNGAVKGSFSTILDFSLVKEMMRECFKERPNYGRAIILLLTVANCLSVFIIYGTVGLDYFYTRTSLHWSLKEYTIFSAASTTISFSGTFVGVGLLQRILPIGDLMFATIAYLTSSVEFVIKGFAKLSWHMYLGASVSMFKGLSSPLLRSYLTKILPAQDIAKVFSLMCAIEGICPLLSPALYNSLYNFTISSFPGAIYILSAGITLSCGIMLCAVLQVENIHACLSTLGPSRSRTLAIFGTILLFPVLFLSYI